MVNINVYSRFSSNLCRPMGLNPAKRYYANNLGQRQLLDKMAVSLQSLSTEDILQKLNEAGIHVTQDEAQKFRENEVDGETIDCGLTENMVSYLFEGSFKKQAKFNKFVREMKEVVTITLEPVPAENYQDTSSTEINATSGRLPAEFSIPPFSKDLQAKLDNKEPCQKSSKERHKIVRVLHEAMIAHTMYPTNAEYVQVAKALIVKYPFLKDLEGNGYHTWHQSLKRKFKAERAPLVHDDEVRKSKDKFGCKRLRPTEQSSTACHRSNYGEIVVIGEDASSIEGHVNILQIQYSKMRPDTLVVKDRMQRTFAWRRREIRDGMTVEDILKKYPFLKTPSGLCDEVDRMHSSTVSLSQRFREGFTSLVPKVLQLVQKNAPLAKIYKEARDEMLAEDLPDADFRAALILLPHIFKEKAERFVTLGECDADTPYPTIQLVETDWKTAFSKRVQVLVKVDRVEVCRGMGVEEGIIAAFSAYYVFNLAYPPCMKNTLTFLQHAIAKIIEVGGKPLPITVTRIINILC
ncbi:sterile alpha motif domain-containing protein 3-like [Misgurnus anguillicaudatus]|uniref:sterile alpha motif domain-containing protein 3-like n=1 Tax=Misgurnus anguillicaudatus TaxID=75329 RepID=UPI003CCF0330